METSEDAFSVSFYRMIPSAVEPQKADPSVGGTLPTRAFRYCEAVRNASGFGWYVFPPMDFSVVWDGCKCIWSFDDLSTWYNLDSAQFPDFARRFDLSCPPEARGFAPPFLSAVLEPGIIQVWSGLFARTSSSWSLLIRPPANFPRDQRFEQFEGIVETDTWFGPLFTNIRITKTDVPIDFKRDLPLFTVQPIHREVYTKAVFSRHHFIDSLQAFSATDWDSFVRTIVAPGSASDRERGHCAKQVRRRGKRDD